MKPLYIFDLDGTLADMTHRLCLLGVWDEFYAACIDDAPFDAVVNTMLLIIDSGADVWIWTARSGRVETLTMKWIERVVGMKWRAVNLRMRGQNEKQNDDVLKRLWLEAMEEKDRKRLVAVFEDRQRVVNMWRKAGVTCFQVDKGKF